MTSTFTAIDLFAGAGGLSLGFEDAGVDILMALEADEWAADTYEFNRDCSCVTRTDIHEVSDAFFSQFSGIDAVIGGPPCQGFSIAASNRRKVDDPRNDLYLQFIRAVTVIRPRIVFIENVTGIVSAKNGDGKHILNDLCQKLESLDYTVEYNLLNALTFGVPQDRKRFFLFASRDGASGILSSDSFVPDSRLSTEFGQKSLWDAISDLPAATVGTPEDHVLLYDRPPANDYQTFLRNKSSGLYNHIPMRHTARVVERMRLILEGTISDTVSDFHAVRRRSAPLIVSDKVYGQNHRRLNPDRPSPTITASFYSSFIHPFEPRNLTVREAARIQSFPDRYRFLGKRTTLSKKLLLKKGIYEDLHLDQFNQVGNAVPPMMAAALASRIMTTMKKVAYA